MICASEAQQKIVEEVRRIGTEKVPLSGALRRFLAGPVVAEIDLPPFDNAAMDGFAVRSGDTTGARLSDPVSLQIIGNIAAGQEGPFRPLQAGQAYGIMTGAPLPQGADAVVPFEETLSPCAGCKIGKPVPPERHVRRAGEDVRKGEEVIGVGDRMTSRTIALLAALGVETVEVFRRPTVKVLCTGNELVSAGAPLPHGKIYNSNGPALTAALQEIGLEPETVVSVSDTVEALERSLKENLKTDVLITVGGVSAGDFDLIPEVLERVGARVVFHRVAIKPGKPFLFATFKKTLIFALPGNPVSSLMVFDRFVRPALLKIMGARRADRPPRIAVAAEDLEGTEGKEDSLRGIVEYRDGRYRARSAGGQGSARLLSLARSNATLIVPEDKKRIRAGEMVEVEILSEEG